jgi:hypothetical protein
MAANLKSITVRDAPVQSGQRSPRKIAATLMETCVAARHVDTQHQVVGTERERDEVAVPVEIDLLPLVKLTRLAAAIRLASTC